MLTKINTAVRDNKVLMKLKETKRSPNTQVLQNWSEQRVLFFHNNISAGHTSLLQVYRGYAVNMKKAGMAS